MKLSERLKAINEAAIDRYQAEIDGGELYQFHLIVKVDRKKNLPFEVLVDVQRSLDIEGVRLVG